MLPTSQCFLFGHGHVEESCRIDAVRGEHDDSVGIGEPRLDNAPLRPRRDRGGEEPRDEARRHSPLADRLSELAVYAVNAELDDLSSRVLFRQRCAIVEESPDPGERLLVTRRMKQPCRY